MNALTLFMRVLATAVPTFGLKDGGVLVQKLLNFGAALGDRKEEGEQQLKELTTEVESMVKDGREPTVEELNGLRERSDAAHAILQGG